MTSALGISRVRVARILRQAVAALRGLVAGPAASAARQGPVTPRATAS